MINYIQVIINMLENIVQLDIFLYLMAALAFYGVIQLIRKAVYDL